MGQRVDAMRSSEASLHSRDAALADADQQLAAILAQAHAIATSAVQRLAAIEDEIESAIRHQDALALDTSEGALSFHRFLLAKQREIGTIVADANNEDILQGEKLESLLPQYLS